MCIYYVLTIKPRTSALRVEQLCKQFHQEVNSPKLKEIIPILGEGYKEHGCYENDEIDEDGGYYTSYVWVCGNKFHSNISPTVIASGDDYEKILDVLY